MSGIRKTETVTCPRCGMQGQVGLGMTMLNVRNDYREFTCIGCNGKFGFRAPRAIVNISWSLAAPQPEKPRPAL